MADINTDLVQRSPSGAHQARVVIAVNADGSPISGGSGGGVGSVEVSNFPSTQAVSGPLTNAQFTAVGGTSAAAAWGGSGNGTLVSILKAIYEQNEAITSLLEDIELNTREIVDPAPTE